MRALITGIAGFAGSHLADLLLAKGYEIYGVVAEKDLPISEEQPLRPISPYAASKAAADLIGYQYYQSYKLNIIRTRVFNHIGPRQRETFVCASFAKQIAEIEKRLKEPVIHVGNLDAKRDFSNVRDIVKAYWLVTEYCDPGEVYNICSGKSYSIKEVLDILLSYAKVKIAIKQDPARMRASDVPILVGDSTKFRKQTGWKPEITFEKTLKDTLDYWRKRV
ncbi:GDP-6-deoxy-D-mannose reductase [subsurface metagenome]